MHDSTTLQTVTDITSTGNRALSRRTIVGGSLGAGLAAAGIAHLGYAQTTSTPGAYAAATPSAGISDDTGQGSAPSSAEDVDSAIERATDMIASVEADRDAVSVDIDLQTVDALLDEATSLRDRAQEVSGSDEEEASRLAWGATATAQAARRVTIADLTYAGLPSQESSTARKVAAAYEHLAGIANNESDEDISFFVTASRDLYSSAYDLYGANAYAQAAATALAAVSVARGATILTGEGGGRGVFGDGHREGGLSRQREELPRSAPSSEEDPKQDTPVTVPEPTFWAPGTTPPEWTMASSLAHPDSPEPPTVAPRTSTHNARTPCEARTRSPDQRGR